MNFHCFRIPILSGVSTIENVPNLLNFRLFDLRIFFWILKNEFTNSLLISSVVFNSADNF